MRRPQPIPSTALAALLAAAALLPLLGAKPLTDWDEAIYAEVAREMVSFGLLVPHWNFQPWFEKPPLAMWLTALLYKLFGVSEFTARAVSALSGVATVSVLHGFVARTRSTLVAWLCTGILLTTFGFLHACHTGELDTLLALTCTVALVGLARVGEDRPAGWLLFWIGFALALMTKGAAAAVLPITAVSVGLLQRWSRFYFRAYFYVGLVLFLALTLPWHLYLVHLYGHRFLDEYLGLHVVTRATHQIEGHTTPWWFFFKVLFVSAPPFVVLYPWAILAAFRRRELQPFALFPLVVLAFYTVVQTRLPQYIVPAYPALAVLVSVYLADRFATLFARPLRLWIKPGLLASAVSIILLLATAPARKSLHSALRSGGAAAADNKDSTLLLRAAFRRPQPIPGPLLLWREGPISSIATDVFYSRRPVQQVTPLPIVPHAARDRYTFNPKPLGEAVSSAPSLILLDRALVPEIPPQFTYTPMEAGSTVELGSIDRLP